MFKYIYSEESILTRIIGLFFGALIISLIIWNRLIRERLPRELTGEPFTLLFWIVLILFVCFFLRMSITVNKFQKNLRGISKPNKYLFKFYIFVKTRYESRPRVKNFCESVGGYLIHYVLEAPLFLWRYLFNNFPHKIVLYISMSLGNFGFFIWNRYLQKEKKKNSYFRQTVIIVILDYMPKVITSFAFFYEALVYRELNNVYKIAVILIIPYIFSALIIMLQDMIYQQLDGIRRYYLHIEVITLEDGDLKYILSPLSDKMPESDFYRTFKHFIEYDQLMRAMKTFHEIKDKYDYICTMLVSTLMTLSLMLWLLVIFGIASPSYS